MNPDDPQSDPADLADLETRLRAWQPAGLPPALRTRLHAAGRRPVRSTPPGAGALAWTLAAAACLAWLAVRFVVPAGPGEHASNVAPGGSPTLSRPPEPDRFADVHWTPGQSLTMNLATGVPPGVVPAAWRLDGGRAELSDLILVRCADGKLPLNVDCQF